MRLCQTAHTLAPFPWLLFQKHTICARIQSCQITYCNDANTVYRAAWNQDCLPGMIPVGSAIRFHVLLRRAVSVAWLITRLPYAWFCIAFRTLGFDIRVAARVCVNPRLLECAALQGLLSDCCIASDSAVLSHAHSLFWVFELLLCVISISDHCSNVSILETTTIGRKSFVLLRA